MIINITGSFILGKFDLYKNTAFEFVHSDKEVEYCATSFWYSKSSGFLGEVPKSVLIEYGVDLDSCTSIDACVEAIRGMDCFVVVTITNTRWRSLA